MADPLAAKKSKILIVDDDPDLVHILTKALETTGYDVVSAPEPAAGLTTARKVKPDLIILDYHMPGTTGAHLYESFRRNESTQTTPIIFMSGDASPEHIQSEIISDKKTRFMTKPAHITDLRNNISELLK
ncbi:MAG: response regulator [Elusimicrobia bacterium]|nr:response regulator [Elusimicrobiota bacterium]